MTNIHKANPTIYHVKAIGLYISDQTATAKPNQVSSLELSLLEYCRNLETDFITKKSAEFPSIPKRPQQILIYLNQDCKYKPKDKSQGFTVASLLDMNYAMEGKANLKTINKWDTRDELVLHALQYPDTSINTEPPYTFTRLTSDAIWIYTVYPIVFTIHPHYFLKVLSNQPVNNDGEKLIIGIDADSTPYLLTVNKEQGNVFNND